MFQICGLVHNMQMYCILQLHHQDGLRLDDVDSMLYLDFGREYGQWRPNIYGTNENLAAVELLKHLNSILAKKLPGTMTIAQEDGLWSELTGSVEDDNIGFSSYFISWIHSNPS